MVMFFKKQVFFVDVFLQTCTFEVYTKQLHPKKQL